VTAPAELAHDRELLREAMRAAGALALEQFRSERRHWYKAPGQVVTAADLAIDRLLHERLLGARPDDGWLSEERADDGSRLARPRLWVVDPIDGTRAFADGVPQFAISVALLLDGEPALGAVLNPATGEHFEAAQGGGAWLGPERLRVSAHSDLAGARLLSSRTEMARRRWPQLIPEAHITAIGSLAYKLALVAAGRFDGLLSLRPCHDWDLAAALLLLREAGGLITTARGEPIVLNRPASLSHLGLAAAGTPALHRALVMRLSEVSP
jgi:myo-inositol-1(or 4)-monophosphatase